MANVTSRPLAVGDHLPDFTLPDQHGNPVRPRDFLGKKAIVIYFYPKDETPGCTTEACAFRDSYQALQEAGAMVFGISGDSVASHQAFAHHHRLPFTLLSDQGNVVRKLFGVPSTLGLLPGRVTYIVDPAGTIRRIVNSQFTPARHVAEALALIRQIQGDVSQ